MFEQVHRLGLPWGGTCVLCEAIITIRVMSLPQPSLALTLLALFSVWNVFVWFWQIRGSLARSQLTEPIRSLLGEWGPSPPRCWGLPSSASWRGAGFVGRNYTTVFVSPGREGCRRELSRPRGD